MNFSLVVATLSRDFDLKNMFESILRQTVMPAEIILVDQSDNDATEILCEEYGKNLSGLKYVHQPEKSLVKARNRGIEESSGDIVCFTDDDVVLEPRYFEKLSAYFQDKQVGGVSGNVVIAKPLSGVRFFLRKILMKIFLLNHFNGKMTLSGFGYPIFEREVKEVTPVELFSGASMNFRRKLLEKERFDEWFSGYGFREDVEFSYRLSRKTKLVVVPDARFWHNFSPVDRLDTAALKKMEFKNYQYVFKKHKRKNFISDILFAYSLFGILFIDFLEFILSFDEQKYAKFRAGLAAISGGQ